MLTYIRKLFFPNKEIPSVNHTTIEDSKTSNQIELEQRLDGPQITNWKQGLTETLNNLEQATKTLNMAAKSLRNADQIQKETTDKLNTLNRKLKKTNLYSQISIKTCKFGKPITPEPINSPTYLEILSTQIKKEGIYHKDKLIFGFN